MKVSGYYSSGEFARMAHVSIRTIRFYDKQNILKPSQVSPSGARYYSDQDLARLQQILLFKFLGFSLEDIRDMTIKDIDPPVLLQSLNLQLKLIQDRIEQLHSAAEAIQDTAYALKTENNINWSQMLKLIHATNIEKSLKSQYQNATNIAARINLHRLYAVNELGWFPWIYKQCNIQPGQRILEIGCGSGALWTENLSLLSSDISIILSDISDGMLRDARRAIGQEDSRFTYQSFDCHHIPHLDNSFDIVIANHLLFYCNDISQVVSEISRVLKPGGTFLCSTYSANHMKEISQLVKTFDNRISLSADILYERFGLANGNQLLHPYFAECQQYLYPDELMVTQPEPLIEYILSCHGNQNQYILDNYKDFRAFVEKKTKHGFHITKEAGIFICRKQMNEAKFRPKGKRIKGKDGQ